MIIAIMFIWVLGVALTALAFGYFHFLKDNFTDDVFLFELTMCSIFWFVYAPTLVAYELFKLMLKKLYNCGEKISTKHSKRC